MLALFCCTIGEKGFFMIRKITLTGADDSTDIGDMIDLSEKYPIIEWGILASKTRMGMPRYPNQMWVSALCRAAKIHHLSTSLHICGRWVRDISQGYWEPIACNFTRDMISSFDRIQINFGHRPIEIDLDSMAAGMSDKPVDFIIPVNGSPNDQVYYNLSRVYQNVAPFFDPSGGRGKSPSEWPQASMFGNIGLCGYAGGLSVDNLDQSIPLILKAAGSMDIWVDAESDFRTEEDFFDLKRAEEFVSRISKF